MSIPRRISTAKALILGVAAGLCFAAQRPSLSAQDLSQPGPLEAAATPASVGNPVPSRLGTPAPPEGAATLLRRASVQGYSGAVLLKVTIDQSGRVAEARPIGLALSGSNTSTYRVVQEDPLPSAEQMFAPDEGMTRAALDIITFARQAARQQQYQPPAGGPLSFHVTVISLASGRLTTATTLAPSDLSEVFPPSAVTSGQAPPFPTTGPAAPVALTSSRWDPASGLPTAGTAAANAGQPSQSRSSTGQAAGGAAGPTASGIAAGTSTPSAPAPPRPTATATSQTPIRVGGNISPPTKTKDVKPAYPAIAQSARVQGIVIVEVVISATGKVTDAKILRSIPLLDGAALDAVKQWEFTPTLLNGQPTTIVMSVTVNFTLDTSEPPALP